uniref:Uncharacterized protein n=1 Tax=Ananas comosus var. bracteatus TaxID=296719 RepID=A0A6V7NNV6_ANACO|nr:unnamed protein product [Ananas comosus var. bracteatus]
MRPAERSRGWSSDGRSQPRASGREQRRLRACWFTSSRAQSTCLHEPDPVAGALDHGLAGDALDDPPGDGEVGDEGAGEALSDGGDGAAAAAAGGDLDEFDGDARVGGAVDGGEGEEERRVLPLSSIDRAANARVSVEFIQVSSRGGSGGAVAAIREGFARALVSYFPVAGRIVESVPGEPMVECSGDGIWFVEAGRLRPGRREPASAEPALLPAGGPRLAGARRSSTRGSAPRAACTINGELHHYTINGVMV